MVPNHLTLRNEKEIILGRPDLNSFKGRSRLRDSKPERLSLLLASKEQAT